MSTSPTKTAPRPSRTRILRGDTASNIIVPVVFLAIGLVIWEIAVRASGVRPQVMPAPSRVVEAGWSQREVIGQHALATIQVTLAGFTLSLILAWLIAIAIDFSPALRRGLIPILVASQTIPVVAIAPLMIIWFGFGLVPKMLVVALVTFFPMTVGLVEGFSRADAESSNLLRSMGAGRIKEFLYVRLPSAMPQFFTSLRIGITYAMTGAIFAEYVGARRGLGIYMSVQKNAFRTDLVLAAVAVTAFISILLYMSTYLLERATIPWHIKERRARNV
ncbi:ABC transporter permease [Corynebacterium aquatimens]|uniref:ABC-type nitrate/sulfonate/bicarbonate transport system permease component n=1 Tax=Corynebacterium aquatimens TaxID=1190508 RepID=A0A931GUD7_9CORY|nr:ABC transporter permease [Corynebacterium aquatimens]MBG6122670.1 ABC-type nitrate/sulfonate/bicarbonate transport system permease component [Corynebacterium aquatimens]WJY64799.1 Putative aliphatic sulfonates transport permease protein SsuC [Corynebacterium aquatimens]